MVAPPPATCGEPPANDNAEAPEHEVPVGGHATFVCHDGYSVDGSGIFEQVVTCMPNQRFSDIIPCLPTTCGTAPNIRNAARAPSSLPLQIVHGMQTAYECLPGYELEGGSTSFEIPCNNGVFGSHHGCSAKSCGAPPSLENAMTSGSTATVSYPNGVEYDCNLGFEVDGGARSFEIQCRADGTFSHGSCQHKVCAAPPALTNAEWTVDSLWALDSESSIVSFTVLQYRCLDGFTFQGQQQTSVRNVECKANGLYGALGTCMPINDCVGHTCGAFGVCVDQHMNYTCDCLDGYETQMVANAEGSPDLICGNVDDCQGENCGEGGTCEDQVGDYTCNCRTGFVLLEHAQSKTCERVACRSPPTVENAVVTSNRDLGGKTVFEDVTLYECNEGYSLNGHHAGARDFSLTCQDDGNFSPVPECIAINCGTPPSVPHPHAVR